MFWLRVPIRFHDHYLHVDLRERPTGSRWVEMALRVPHGPVEPGGPCGTPVEARLRRVPIDRLLCQASERIVCFVAQRRVPCVELATLLWVEWFNHQRLHGELGHLTPVEVEDL